jgi:hypothetical protein
VVRLEKLSQAEVQASMGSKKRRWVSPMSDLPQRRLSSGHGGRRPVDLSGMKFGTLTAVELTERRASGGHCIWKLRCECGAIIESDTDTLLRGNRVYCRPGGGPHIRALPSIQPQRKADHAVSTSGTSIIVAGLVKCTEEGCFVPAVMQSPGVVVQGVQSPPRCAHHYLQARLNDRRAFVGKLKRALAKTETEVQEVEQALSQFGVPG